MGDGVRRWLIISWRHNDHMDGAYGEFIVSCVGSYEDACKEARKYVADFSPIGVVGVIE
jgi:hypothetical protein